MVLQSATHSSFTFAPGARALITGITGQDGYYLARTIAQAGGQAWGGVRPDELPLAEPLRSELALAGLIPCDLEDPEGLAEMVRRVEPTMIVHLAAQSSVRRSWEDPALTVRVNGLGTLHLLEAVRRHAPRAHFVLAGSCDCFDHEAAGERGVTPATPLRATNPYAASKVMAQQLAQCYRREHGLRASVAILFNHTSPRRGPMFVERGIVHHAVRVARGQQPAVVIGSMDTRRDWSWAPELVEGLARLGAREEPEDLVFASGQTMTVGDWVRETFSQLGLDLERHVRIDPARLHPGDRPHAHGNIERTREALGWSPRIGLGEMVSRLIAAENEVC